MVKLPQVSGQVAETLQKLKNLHLPNSIHIGSKNEEPVYGFVNGYPCQSRLSMEHLLCAVHRVRLYGTCSSTCIAPVRL